MGRSRTRAISTKPVKSRYDAATATASTAAPVTTALSANAASTTPTIRTTAGVTGTPNARSAPTALAGSTALATPAAASSSAAMRNGPAQTPIRRRRYPPTGGAICTDHQHAVDQRHQARPAGVGAEHDVEAERAAGLAEERLVRALAGDAPPAAWPARSREPPGPAEVPGTGTARSPRPPARTRRGRRTRPGRPSARPRRCRSRHGRPAARSWRSAPPDASAGWRRVSFVSVSVSVSVVGVGVTLNA